MKDIREIKFHSGSKEELLPDFTPEFPYIASRVELDHYHDRTVPWHWHGAVELSYTLHGCIKYYTPGGVSVLPEGAAALVNANVLLPPLLQCVWLRAEAAERSERRRLS